MSNKDFEDFIGKFGTPLAIIIGALVIAGSIFFSLNPDFDLKTGNKQAAAPTPPSTGTGNQAAAPAPGPIQNISTAGLPMLGKANAPVTLVEFGDFKCQFCGRFFRDTLPSIKKDYIDTGKVKFYYNDFAFLGTESIRAAEAAKCAEDQNKFWEYHDYLYTILTNGEQVSFSDANLKKFAGEINLNQNSFNSCLDSKKYEQAVKDETDRGRNYGVNATPTSFINGEMVRGAVPYESIKAKIEEELKK